MAPHMFGIIGWSRTGKTTVTERLVVEFRRRGYRVATLKHDDEGTPPPVQAIVPLLGDVDLVVVEGFEEANWPKLEMHEGSGTLSRAGDPWLVAAAGPRRPRSCPVPWYHWDEITLICDMMENILRAGLARRWATCQM